jgi:hypothetical protein
MGVEHTRICSECRKPLPDDWKYGLCKKCGEAAERSGAIYTGKKTAPSRDRLHRALDAILDRRATRDADPVAAAERKLAAAEKREQAARDRVSRTTAARRNKGQRFQSQSEMTARSILSKASSAVWEARAAVQQAKETLVQAGDAAGDVRVIWTDRNYDRNEARFKNDSAGAPENALVKARALVKRLEQEQKARTIRIVQE